MIVGLRIDVDTLRGTRIGVPFLLGILEKHRIHASIFFSVGPDNMGRHLWRLVKPQFLVKMLRSRAASLYGWDILLRGTLWPGPRILDRCGEVVRQADRAGHEIGLHAWDHYRWQTYIESMSPQDIRHEIQLGLDALRRALGRDVDCSAVAGWRCTPQVLIESLGFGFRYNSDCRGTSIFKPLVAGIECPPQVPVTLPTYDEIVGRQGIDDRNYNQHMLSLIRPGRLNVLTIHAEVEGIAKSGLFSEFLHRARQQDITFVPLGMLLEHEERVPMGSIEYTHVRGRDGRVCHQSVLKA